MCASDAVLAGRKGAPISIDAARCTGCRICELRCSLRFEKAFNTARAAILIRRAVDGPTEYTIAFTERCDSCGICARYCCYGALSQEKKGGERR
jgi:ferredoxin